MVAERPAHLRARRGRGCAALAPDVVVTQAACEVCAISYDQVVRSAARARRAAPGSCRSSRPAWTTSWTTYARVRAACGVPDARRRLVAGSARAPDGGRSARRPAPGRGSPSSSGWPRRCWPGTGCRTRCGRPAASRSGPARARPSPYATWDEVARARADAASWCPVRLRPRRARGRGRALRATSSSTLAPRVLLLDGNAYLNRPGPRLVEAVETIAGWLQDGFVANDRGIDLRTPTSR